MIEAKELAQFLTDRFGLPVAAERTRSPDGQLYKLRPDGVPHTKGFTLEFLIGWRSISASFKPGKFAAELVDAMRGATHEQLAVYQVFTQRAVDDGAEIRLFVNEQDSPLLSPGKWPSDWRSVGFAFRKGALVLDPLKEQEQKEIVYPWAARFFGIVLSLLPVEPVEESGLQVGEEEGRTVEGLVKRYERSRMNRAACIEIHGLTCKACGMDFSSTYGPLGEGFIHVHHVTPLSAMDDAYVLNPATDLVPVCPNCHAMLHRQRPPLSVDELRGTLNPH